MNIEVNGKPMEVAEGTTLQNIVETLQLPERGVAAAVNNKMIPRTEWNSTEIENGAKIVIIKAACGG